ncbi:MAG: glycosyltransferase family 1 protein [Pseudomonadota bacterium]
MQFDLLVNPAAPRPLLQAPNVREYVVRAGTNTPLSVWALPEIAPLQKCDIFHATANILPARLGMKTVVSIHDLMWLDHPGWCDSTPLAPIKRAFYQSGIRRALNRANAIAAISDATKTAILARHPALADRTQVTLPGLSARFAPAAHDQAILARYGLDADAPFALVVGQNAPYKNHQAALRGFAAARAGAPAHGAHDAHHAHHAHDADPAWDKARLVLVQRQGGGRHDLRALADDLGIGDAIIFTGPVDEAGLIQLYSRARALLHPSLCEGFGNPVVEAMACGCPVITSNLSAMPQTAGGAAILIDPRDPDAIAGALNTVWHDPARRAAMKQAGMARAGRLNWGDCARANIAIYRALIAAS